MIKALLIGGPGHSQVMMLPDDHHRTPVNYRTDAGQLVLYRSVLFVFQDDRRGIDGMWEVWACEDRGDEEIYALISTHQIERLGLASEIPPEFLPQRS